MSVDRQVIAACLVSREAFQTCKETEVPDGFTDRLAAVWSLIRDYYEADPAASRCSAEVLIERAKLESRNPKHREAMERLIRDIAETEVSAVNINRYLQAVERERRGDALAAAILGREPQDKVDALMEALAETRTMFQEMEPEGTDWEGLLQRRISRQGRVKATPKALDRRLGEGLYPGHSVLVFARPEAGKSAFAVSFACGAARRGEKVLYLGNEDPIDELATRALRNLSGMRDLSNPKAVLEAAMKAGAGNIVFRDITPGTLGEIERLVRAHRPRILIVDQLRNLSGGSVKSTYTEWLDKAAQGIRSIAKRYNLVALSVTQAGDSAEAKAVLSMGDVDFSNTGIPGAMDVMIGIGVTEQLEKAGVRMLSLPKNKLGGVHDSFQVKIDPVLSKFTSQEE